MSTETKPISLLYEERNALPVIRKLLIRKPQAAALLMQGMSRDAAISILLQAKKEINDLLILQQAMVLAAQKIIELDKGRQANNLDISSGDGA